MKKGLIILILFLFGISGCKDEPEQCIDESKINEMAACTREYVPVCGCNQVTYGNTCEAENAGVLRWTDGECES